LSQIKKLAGQTAVYGLSSIIGRLLNYLLVPLYTRIFDPTAYGVVSEFYAYVTFLIVLFTYGMETAYFHFSTGELDKEKVSGNTLSMLLLSSSLLTGVLIFFSNSIANAIGYALHPEYIVWFALILAFDALTAVPFAKLRQQNKAKKFAFLKLLNIGINIGLNLFFLYLLPKFVKEGNWADAIYNPTMGVGYVFIANLISSAVTLMLLLPDFRKIIFPIDNALAKQMLIYAFPILIAGFAGMINETLDRAILKYLITDKSIAMQQLGIYSACYKLSILMTLFVQTYRYAAEPFFFSQRNKGNAKELYASIMNYFVLICSTIFLVVMLYIDVIKLFIGEKFYSGLKIVPILLIANLCLGIYLNLSMWYKLSGQTKYGAWLSIFGAAITILFNLWLIPIMGYTGAAWATLICYASMMIASYIIGQKKYPIPYDVSKFFIFTTSAIGCWMLSNFIHSKFVVSNTTFAIINTVLLAVYFGAMWKLLGKQKIAINNVD
jgi:O-antigen/teichoic acid export membrane protein